MLFFLYLLLNLESHYVTQDSACNVQSNLRVILRYFTVYWPDIALNNRTSYITQPSNK